VAVLFLYALAKLAEFYDGAIYAGLPVSGHSVKHLVAAMATYFIFRWRCAATDQTSAVFELAAPVRN
jgi:hypothetical protein